MKIVLTGITGNLGHELFLYLLNKKEFEVIPVIRQESLEKISSYKEKFKEVILNDLLSDEEIDTSCEVDCIIHCAGIVDFHRSGDSNQKMMKKVITFSQKLNIPVYFVSTAFVYKPKEDPQFKNSYEIDKFKSEQLLIDSGLEYAIMRPSVIVGSSVDGHIQNISGYYSIVKSFLWIICELQKENKKIKFPQCDGFSNIVPVDYVAQSIVDIVKNKKRGIYYLTHPNPPKSDVLLKETLTFFKLLDRVDLVKIDYEECVMLPGLTESETKFYKFGLNFQPYWSMKYNFPKTCLDDIKIDTEYISKILEYFVKNENLKHE